MASRVHVYRVLDRDYPHELRALSAPPDPLWVRGELLAGPRVAIVGTRKPSAEAAAHAHGLALRLAKRGVTVWSGGAVGIDAAAHRGALEAGAATVAVIGTGLDHCYPPEHEDLYERIVRGDGALVSPFERSQAARLWTFPHRNGVLAALTHATVVVQAPIQSGARSMAAAARRLRRPLFVVPAAPWDERAQGNLLEIALGARPLADENELLDRLGIPRAPVQLASSPVNSAAPRRAICATTAAEDFAVEQLAPECQALFGMLSSNPLHLDDLCARSGLPTALVQAALLTLSLQAVLVEGPAGWFRRVTFRKDSA